MGQYNLMGQLVQLAMVDLLVVPSVTGFDPSVLEPSILKREPGYQGLYIFTGLIFLMDK